MADDLGYGDLSCYGRPDYDTPVLDRLALDLRQAMPDRFEGLRAQYRQWAAQMLPLS